MKRSAPRIFVAAALAVALALPAFSLDAFAKRAGGGGSFGGRPSYNRTYTPPAAPMAPAAPSGPSQMNQQRPATPPPATPAPSPGFGSRMGWGMGGFLMGGLLGSMLFGGGFGGGFGGVGLLDILLIGGIIFLAFKLLRGRSSAGQGSGQNVGQQPYGAPPDSRSGAEQSWDRLRSAPPTGSGSFGDGSSGNAAGQQPQQGPAVPEGFNTAEFLEGAKTVYSRIQAAWDRRDLADIALFATPEVHQEMARQAKADPGPSRTELLMVNARLVEYREDGGDSIATVLFDVLMREDASEDRPKQVREVWHFSRESANPSSNWRLEGIQQLEG